MNLTQVIARFNRGCALLASALEALTDRNFTDFESQLIGSGGDAIGSLEWAMKIYLRQNCRPRLSDADYALLHRPDFNTLIELLQRYAEPSLEESKLASFEKYRRAIRNPGEHDALVPSVEQLDDAISNIRWFLIEYLGVDVTELSNISTSSTGVFAQRTQK